VGGSVLIIILNRGSVDLDALGLDHGFDLNKLSVSGMMQTTGATTYSLLVTGKIGGAKGIGLGDDGDQVDAGAQTLHHFDIEGFQGVAGGADEVQAGMHTHVNFIRAAGLLLLQHVRLMLVIEELNDGLPGVTVVDIVSEAGGINDSQADYMRGAPGSVLVRKAGEIHHEPLKNFSSNSALVISISTVRSICFW
jgi:hypothetical protein